FGGGNYAEGRVDYIAWTAQLTSEAQGAMQSNTRLATGESGKVDSHLPSQAHDVKSKAGKGKDIVAATKPAVGVLQTTSTLANWKFCPLMR
ncbi:MAG TPA: hypothetical protein VHC96_01730, partial [Puia sp.]|nr:hypothetical protein [Puia sp.]